jgi:hypothetical protein
MWGKMRMYPWFCGLVIFTVGCSYHFFITFKDWNRISDICIWSMPFWGLVVTSSGFLLPFLIAKRRNRRRDMILSAGLTCTSLWFHTTGSPMSFFIDKVYAHSLGGMFWCESVHNLWQRRRKIDVIFVATTNGIIYIYFCKSRVQEGIVCHLWHMTMHVVAITGWVVYLIK